jgi:23S rRNA (adenine2030-N6)-methyltransferase
MNYKHIFHAGNFADVLKHSIMVNLLHQQLQNTQPLLILDTHSGAGRYDLDSPESDRSPEFLYGIKPLYEQKNVEEKYHLYLELVKKTNKGKALQLYPGSPLLISYMLRSQDIFYANELHEKEFFRLQSLLRGNKNIIVSQQNGYDVLEEFLQKSGRKFILIDPPFEKLNEFDCLYNAVEVCLSTKNTITLIWYPEKEIEAKNFTEFLQKNNAKILSSLLPKNVKANLRKSTIAILQT